MRTDVRSMARPPQYERDAYADVAPATAGAVKVAMKRLDPSGRVMLFAWLCLYCEDDGALLSPKIGRRRRRIVLDGIEYWLVRVPKP
jgi:hypothetical protein